MRITKMSFTFSHEQLAKRGLSIAQDLIEGNATPTGEPHLDGIQLTLRRCSGVQTTALDDEQGFFMQLCFLCAAYRAPGEFTGICYLETDDKGTLSAEKVFYDGDILGFKFLDEQEPDFDERVWRDVSWDLWIPQQGTFVNLDEWRTSSDL